MKRLVLVLLALASFAAHAGVDGNWQCDSVAEQSVYDNVTGAYIGTQTIRTNPALTLYPNGTFESRTALPIVGRGHWGKRRDSVTLQGDTDSLVEAAEYGCSLAGRECTVISVSSQIFFKKKGNRMKGVQKYNMTLHFADNGTVIYAEGNGKSVCRR